MTEHDAHEWVELTNEEILDNIRRKLSDPEAKWVRLESNMKKAFQDAQLKHWETRIAPPGFGLLNEDNDE